MTSPIDDPVTLPRQVLDDLLRRVAALEATGPDAATVLAPSRPLGRRAAIAGLAGAAVVGTVGAVTSAAPAAAANGDPLVLGSVSNQATAATGLAVTGLGRGYGIGATDNGYSGVTNSAALFGHARNQAFYTAVRGLAEGSTTGVHGSTERGVAVRATGGRGVGVDAEGELAGIQTYSKVMPLIIPPSSSTLPTGTAALAGTFFTTTATTFLADLWFRVDQQTASPGGWRKLAGPDTAGAFHLLPTPKRVYDTRPGTTPAQGPKTKLPAGNVARTIDLKHNASGVPAEATGVLLTVLLVNATSGAGNLTVWADDKPKPQSNTLVWGGDAGRFTATATTAVDPQARIKVDASLATWSSTWSGTTAEPAR